jgi:thymidine kinase
MNPGSITLILGPMFAGKSTYLLAQERKSKIAKKKVVCVKYHLDTRYTSGTEITTHNKDMSTAPSYSISSLSSIYSELINYDVILIDEGQFFNDLTSVSEDLASKGKHITIAALGSDYKRNAFLSITELLPKVDHIEYLKAICPQCGEDASFTSRLIHQNSQTFIGGSESYEPRCRKCFT